MNRFLFLLIFFSVLKMHVLTAQDLSPLDSLYLDGMAGFYDHAEAIAGEIWPGMNVGPFCIFRMNGPAFLMNHPNPPGTAKQMNNGITRLEQSDYGFSGATQSIVNDVLTAHNDYGQAVFGSINQFYAELFHELHHVYQRNYIKKLRFDNPAVLLTYPENPENDAVKQYENEVLLELLTGSPEQFRQNMNRFYTCRKLRNGIIGDKYATYEKEVESVEGPATYCEFRYMQTYGPSAADSEYIHHKFYYGLIEPAYGRSGLRNKHLLTGMAQCIILSKYYANWQEEYYNSGLLLNDYFFSKFNPVVTELPDLSSYRSRAYVFTNLEKQKHQAHLDDFNHQDGVKIILNFKQIPDFRGFDPMHAEAVNDSLILHNTLLRLARGDNRFNLVNTKVASTVREQVWFVKSIVLYLPEEAFELTDRAFICHNENIDINWKVVNYKRAGKTLFAWLE